MPSRLIAMATVIGFAPGLAACEDVISACATDVTANCQVAALVTAPIWVPITLLNKPKPDVPSPNVVTSTPDDAQAMRLNRPLAEKGDADAQYNLGLLYSKENIPQDDIVADTWF